MYKRKTATYKNLAHYGRAIRTQKWTVFIQSHRQQPDEDPDGEWRTGKMMMSCMKYITD